MVVMEKSLSEKTKKDRNSWNSHMTTAKTTVGLAEIRKKKKTTTTKKTKQKNNNNNKQLVKNCAQEIRYEGKDKYRE